MNNDEYIDVAMNINVATINYQKIFTKKYIDSLDYHRPKLQNAVIFDQLKLTGDIVILGGLELGGDIVGKFLQVGKGLGTKLVQDAGKHLSDL